MLLTLGLSLFETARGGPQAFFDAAVTLLFFLLVGRYLDCLMRDRARSAVNGLARLAAKGAMRVRSDGSPEYLPLDARSRRAWCCASPPASACRSTPGCCAARPTSTARW